MRDAEAESDTATILSDDESDPPARPDAIGAAFFQVEPASHVVEEDAGIARRYGGAEATAQGLGDVAVAIGGGEVGGHAPVEGKIALTRS